MGVPVVDADDLAREVVEIQSFGLDAVKKIFRNQVVSGEGVLDRKALARIIFSDTEKRKLLENIIHPLIQWRVYQEKEYFIKKKYPLVFYDAALIFEKGLKSQFTSILVVHATEETQILRLASRDSLSDEEIKIRISAQLKISEKIALADHLIDNNGTVEFTKHQVSRLLEKLLAGA